MAELKFIPTINWSACGVRRLQRKGCVSEGIAGTRSVMTS